MKSQRILIRNLPDDGSPRKKIALKPTIVLYGLLAVGVGIFFINKVFALVSVSLILVSAFSLIVLPDRTLCVFAKDWMALYNQHNKQECMMIYYEDIVSWQYEWHSYVDSLIICLLDGTTESLDVYSKYRIEKLMNEHVPGKEIKSIRTKR
jgi:hypothetical protein